jgi:hypothetical protein
VLRRLCVLLDAERVYRELGSILEGEADLEFASLMIQVRQKALNLKARLSNRKFQETCFGMALISRGFAGSVP